MLGNGKTYESMLNDLGNSKETWLELLEYNKIHSIWKQKLDFLLQNEADLREWNAIWSGNIDKIPADICDFRQHKIHLAQQGLTFAEFEILYRSNRKEALETLFVEAVPEWMLNELDAKRITCKGVYKARIEGKEHIWNLINAV
ncbi:hypothetical protein [Paenibacillus odorifer]|uniref:hypothetical protein n=1 Tax=Paenibacillus odorifer TaxID=189426 RepID=UPI00289ED441|nr:hypothetical protein [Paenibacillus odorifer]